MGKLRSSLKLELFPEKKISRITVCFYQHREVRFQWHTADSNFTLCINALKPSFNPSKTLGFKFIMPSNAITTICCKADTMVEVKVRPLNISIVKSIKVHQSKQFS